MNLLSSTYRQPSWLLLFVSAWLWLGPWNEVVAQTPCALYVNASDGADTNPGSQTLPFRSLEVALSRTSDQEFLCVAAGEYYHGDDRDGIAVNGENKHVTLVLNAFAGEEVIRVSGREFLMDLAGGSLSIRNGTATEIVFGSGVLNQEADSGMQSFRLLSGMLIVATDIQFTIEGTVGRSDNPGARIEFGNGKLIGTPWFSPAPRRIVVSNTAPTTHTVLPAPGTGGIFSHASSAPAIILADYDLSGTTFVSTSSAKLTYAGLVTVEPSSFVFEGASSKPRLDFASRLLLTGQAGSWSLDAEELSINELNASTPGAWSISLTAVQGSIGAVRAATDAEVNLLLAGVFTLGSGQPGAPVTWPGQLHVSTGEIVANGDVTIAGSTPLLIDAPAALVFNTGAFISSSENAIINIHGSLASSSGAPSLHIGATSTIELTGTLSGLRVDNAAATLNGSGHLTSYVTLQNGAHVLVSGDIGGHSSLDLLNSVLEFNPDSSLETNTLNSTRSTITLPANSRLQISGSATFDSESLFTSASGEIVLGTDATLFEEYTNSTLPHVISYAGSLEMTAAGDIAELSVLAGRSNVTTGGAFLRVDSLSVRNSTLSLNTQSSLLLLPSGFEAENAAINFEGTGRLELSGVVHVQSSDISWPLSGVAAGEGGILEVRNSEPLTLPFLVLDHSSAIVLLSSDVTVRNDLHLERGKLIVDSGSTLTLLASLSRSDGRFEPVEGGLVRFSGDQSERTITGFTSSVLPSIEIESAHVILDEDGTILGGLRVTSGSFALKPYRSLSVAAEVVLDGGHMNLDAASHIFAPTDFFLRLGSISLNGALLHVGRDFLVSEDVLISGIPDELQIGSSSPSSLSIHQSLRTRDFVASGLEPITISGSELRVGRTLRVTDQTRVDVRSKVRLDGQSFSPVALNDGVMSGVGTLVFSGPVLEGVQHGLSGSGIWSHIEIDLSNPDGAVLAPPGMDPIRLAGGMTFTRGGLDVNGHPVLLSAMTDAVLPLISIHLTKGLGTTGNRDGRGFVNSAGFVQILTESRYSLEYTGEVQTLVEPGNELRPGLVQALKIDIRDAVNTPPVFGFNLTESLDLSGSLHIGPESLVRLEGADILLYGAGSNHTVAGRLVGPGRLLLTAAGTRIAGKPGSPSRVGRFLVDVQSGLDEVSLVDMASADMITIAGGNVAIQGSESSFSLRVLEMTSGQLRVAQNVRIVTGGHLSISAGQIQMDVDSRISLQDNVPISVDGTVEWSVLPSQPEDGYVTLLGSHSVMLETEIPRLRLDPPPSELHSITALSDLVITEHLDQQAGQINLGSRRLHVDNAVWTLGQFANSDFAVFGDAATQLAGVEFSSAVKLELHSELRIFATRLTARSTTLHLTQLEGAGASRNLVVQGGQVSLQSGSVHLGSSDFVITSSQTDALTLGSELEIVDGSGQDVDRNRSEGLFDDGLFGEIVVSGSGTTNIVVESSAVISSLRVTGTVQILADSGDIQILNRLVFGSRGSTLLTNRAGQIVLADNAILVRRGKGSVSHRPTFTDRIHLAYDLDDGSWTGLDTGFLDGTMTTGIELPNRVQSLDILSGNRDATVNELRLGAPVIVTDRLSILSGRFDSSTSGRSVTLVDGVQLRLGGVDSDAPATWNHDGSTVFEGSLSITQLSFRSFDFSTSLVPTGVPLDTIQFSLLTSATTFRLGRELIANVITFSGVDASNRVRLSGHTTRAVSALTAQNVSVESSEIADFISEGALSVQDGAVRENVRIAASGDLFLDAEITNLEVISSADLSVHEQRFSPQKLTLNGAGGEWILKDNVQLGTLSLDLSEGNHYTMRATRTASEAVVLRVTGSLQLVSGVLSSRGVVTELAAGRPGYVRFDGHVSGPVRQHVSSGESGTISFPVGSLHAYTPISVTPRSAFIADATFTASARLSPTHDRNGLPITGPDSRILVDASREVWSLTSSVNFAQSQPATISVAVENPPTGTASSFQLIRRQPTHAAPWQSIPGSPISTASSFGMVVQHVDATGILVTSGIEIGMGSGTQSGEPSASFQVVNLTALDYSIEAGENSFNLTPGSASALWTGGLPVGSTSLEWIARSDENTNLALSAFNMHGQTGIGILLPASLPTETALPLTGYWISPTEPTGSHFAVIHAWQDGPLLSLEMTGPTASYTANLEPGGNTQLVSMGSSSFSLSSTFASPENRTEQYLVDLSKSGPPSAIILLRESAFLVTQDGNVVPLAIVTGVEGDGTANGSADGSADDAADPDRAGAELPTEYRLHQNYPNPFNPTTVIPFDLPEPAAVRLTVIDLLGRVVARQDAGQFQAGRHASLRFNAEGLASGTYLYVVEATRAGAGMGAGSGSGMGAGAAWRATGRMTVLR